MQSLKPATPLLLPAAQPPVLPPVPGFGLLLQLLLLLCLLFLPSVLPSGLPPASAFCFPSAFCLLLSLLLASCVLLSLVKLFKWVSINFIYWPHSSAPATALRSQFVSWSLSLSWGLSAFSRRSLLKFLSRVCFAALQRIFLPGFSYFYYDILWHRIASPQPARLGHFKLLNLLYDFVALPQLHHAPPCP